jgi:AcrR family transcriptional regulator
VSKPVSAAGSSPDDNFPVVAATGVRGDHAADLSSQRSEAASVSGKEDDARARLLAAAGPVFAKHGFDRATVREICGAAGVNIASVGYYFGDKFGLYREVFRVIRNQCPDDFAQFLCDRDGQEIADPRQQIYLLVYHVLSRMLARDDSGWESQLMMREMNHPTAVFAEMVEESFRPHFERMMKTIASMSPSDTPVHVLEQLALSVVGQCLYYRVGSGVVKRLIPAERLAADFTVQSLARHIAAVTIAAAENGLAMQHRESLSRIDFVEVTAKPVDKVKDNSTKRSDGHVDWAASQNPSS